jgi:hypothetical protein
MVVFCEVQKDDLESARRELVVQMIAGLVIKGNFWDAPTFEVSTARSKGTRARVQWRQCWNFFRKEIRK